jgi:GNAT superfamily N-acetyltransferase
MQLAVRDARQDDAAAISLVDAASHREAYRPIFGADYMTRDRPDAGVERWERILAGGPPDPDRAARWVLVAVADAEVVAYAGLMPSRDADAQAGEIGEVGAIYVHPTLWRQGIGSFLLRASLERLRDLGFREATLWTLEANSRARSFYEKEGWLADGGRQVNHRPGLSDQVEIRYRKALITSR